jgi:PPOX class probable F420-dependent enzyme
MERSVMVSLDELARELFDEPNFAHVATLMPDGSPHVVPVWIGREADQLLFVKEEGSVGLRNAERDPRVAISIVAQDNPYLMANLGGRVVEVRRGTQVRTWLDDTAMRYTGRPYPDPVEGVLLVVEADRVIAQALPLG